MSRFGSWARRGRRRAGRPAAARSRLGSGARRGSRPSRGKRGPAAKWHARSPARSAEAPAEPSGRPSPAVDTSRESSVTSWRSSARRRSAAACWSSRAASGESATTWAVTPADDDCSRISTPPRSAGRRESLACEMPRSTASSSTCATARGAWWSEAARWSGQARLGRGSGRRGRRGGGRRGRRGVGRGGRLLGCRGRDRRLDRRVGAGLGGLRAGGNGRRLCVRRLGGNGRRLRVRRLGGNGRRLRVRRFGELRGHAQGRGGRGASDRGGVRRRRLVGRRHSAGKLGRRWLRGRLRRNASERHGRAGLGRRGDLDRRGRHEQLCRADDHRRRALGRRGDGPVERGGGGVRPRLLDGMRRARLGAIRRDFAAGRLGAPAAACQGYGRVVRARGRIAPLTCARVGLGARAAAVTGARRALARLVHLGGGAEQRGEPVGRRLTRGRARRRRGGAQRGREGAVGAHAVLHTVEQGSEVGVPRYADANACTFWT
jgi:hypothetical protein